MKRINSPKERNGNVSDRINFWDDEAKSMEKEKGLDLGQGWERKNCTKRELA